MPPACKGGVERNLAAPATLHGGENGIETIDRPADIDLESAPDDIGRKFLLFGDEINARVYEGERDLSVRSIFCDSAANASSSAPRRAVAATL